MRSFRFKPPTAELLVLSLLLIAWNNTFGGDAKPMRVRVIDPDGRPVRGARVTSTAGNMSCTTSDGGTCSLIDCSLIDQVPLTLEVTALGFSEERTMSSGIRMAEIKLHIKPHVGTVVVSAREEPASGGEIGSVRTAEQIDRVPVWLRKTDGLLPLFPGTVPRPSDNDLGEGISAAGSRTTATNSLLDGMPNRAERRGGLAIQPSLESVAEFKILTSGYSVEYGHTPGPQVLITTRSGSDELHGSVYNYARDRMGGVLGGPIQKKEAYFFFSYEGAQTNFEDPVTSTVPKSDQLHAANVSAIAQKLLPLLPVSQSGSVTNEGEHSIERQYILRIDRLLTGNSHLSARAARQNSVQVLFPDSLTELPQYWPPIKDNSDSSVLSFSHDTDRGLVLLRASFLDSLGSTSSSCHNNAAYSVTLGNSAPTIGCPTIAITGYPTFGDGGKLYNYRSRTGELSGAVSRVLGLDTLKVGAFANLVQYASTDPTEENGYLDFTGQFSGSPIVDFLQGTPAVALRDFNKAQQRGELRQTGFGGFIQNTLRLGESLSIDLGIRAEFRPSMTGINGQLSSFRPSLGSVVSGRTQQLLPSQGIGVDPRVGFSWRLFQSTVVRGGVGQFSGEDLLSTVLGQLTSAASRYGLVGSASGVPPMNPQDPVWTPVDISMVRGIDSRNLLMKSYQYSLTIEQPLAAGAVLELAYIGSRGLHLGRLYDVNMPLPTGLLDSSGSPVTKRTFPGFGDIIYEDQGASSHYNSGRIAIHKRTAGLLDLNLTYTYSKSIDDASATDDQNFSEQPYAQDIRHLERERGYSDFDHRHQLTGYVSIQMDKLWHTAALRRSEIAAVVSTMSGPRFTLVTDDQYLFRPDVISNPFANVPHGYYFNPAAFQVHGPTVSQPNYFGNLGRNALVGPYFNTIDLAFNKGFRIRSRADLKIRVEVFNFLDRKVPSVGNILSDPGFGKTQDFLNQGRLFVAGARFAF